MLLIAVCCSLIFRLLGYIKSLKKKKKKICCCLPITKFTLYMFFYRLTILNFSNSVTQQFNSQQSTFRCMSKIPFILHVHYFIRFMCAECYRDRYIILNTSVAAQNVALFTHEFRIDQFQKYSTSL